MICYAYTEQGTICRREAIAIDEQRGHAVCAEHLPAGRLPEISARPLSRSLEEPGTSETSASAAAPCAPATAAWPEDF